MVKSYRIYSFSGEHINTLNLCPKCAEKRAKEFNLCLDSAQCDSNSVCESASHQNG